MRITVSLPDELAREARTHAAERGTTLSRLIEGSLRRRLTRARGRATETGPVQLTTCGGHGVRPGVDLDDSAGLLGRMED